MKAYVIKNKEGKYWNFVFNNRSEFVNIIYNAFMHYSKNDAEKDIDLWQLKDCEIEEITIIEGDLEHQLRHQVCQEIRENSHISTFDVNIIGNPYATYYTISEINLQEIEKGETKC